MSRLARAVEILEAINKHFQEGADCVYRDGLILSDDSTLGDAIRDCVGIEETETEIHVPRSQRKRIGKNIYGNWVGFIGRRRVEDFGVSEEAALQWLWKI